MDIIKITDSDLNLHDMFLEVCASTSCAVCVFTGTKEDVFATSCLWDIGEASRTNAELLLLSICKDVRKKYSVGNIAIHCRFEVPGGYCLGIACVASNYSESSNSIQYIIHLINNNAVTNIHTENDAYFMEQCNDNDESDTVPSNLIQIKVGTQEIKRRIDSFIEKKREQVNTDNIKDFCYHGVLPSVNSCARVDAMLIHRKDSKSHLRVRKVCNSWGPQTRHTNTSIGGGNLSSQYTENELYSHSHYANSPNNKDNYETHSQLNRNCKFIGLEERLRNIEQQTNVIGPVPADIYERLKKIEDRVLYLEGLSPEYFEFSEASPHKSLEIHQRDIRKRSYTATELNNKIKELECSTVIKPNSTICE